MPAPTLYARESEDKDTAKNVIFKHLIILFLKISEKSCIFVLLIGADGAACGKEVEIK